MSNRSRSRNISANKASAPAGRQQLILAVLAVGVLIIIVLLTLRAGGWGNAAAGLPPDIGVNEAYQKYKAGAFVLDVRTQAEWDEYHVPGTTLIPIAELAQRLGELPRDQVIVVVCRSGNRSQQARHILLNAGFTQVTSMTGGLKVWRDKGYPIESAP